MDEEILNSEINSFIQSKDVDDKTKDKMTYRLIQSVHFMADLGVEISDIPSNAHYDKLNEYLHTLIQPRGKHKGEIFSDSVIRDWVNITKKFYNRNGKLYDDSNTTESQIAITELEAVNHAITENTKGDTHDMTTTNENMNSVVSADPEPEQPQPFSPVEAVRKPGRPETTGRTEKFTLYMTPELWKKITMLADLDEVKITDLMNDALEYYCEKERSEDIAFLYTLERSKQEHRRQKARA